MIEEKQLIPVDVFQQMETALDMIESIQEIQVTSDEEYQNAVQVCKDIKSTFNSLESQRKELVKPLNDDVKEINGKFKDVTNKLSSGEIKFKNAMSNYQADVERKQREAQAKLEAEAAGQRRKAEEKARVEAEKAEAYRQAGRVEMAEKAEARAEAAEEKATNTVAPVIEQQKTKGVSYRTTYVATVSNKEQVIQHCLSVPNLLPLIGIDVKAIEKLANATKGVMVIPGVSYREVKSAIVRTK